MMHGQKNIKFLSHVLEALIQLAHTSPAQFIS